MSKLMQKPNCGRDYAHDKSAVLNFAANIQSDLT